MAEHSPDMPPTEPREKSVESVLAAARPLPNDDEMVIRELTEDEERGFYEALAQT